MCAAYRMVVVVQASVFTFEPMSCIEANGIRASYMGLANGCHLMRHTLGAIIKG